MNELESLNETTGVIRLNNDDVVESIGVAIKEKKYGVACNMLIALNNWRISNDLRPYELSEILFMNWTVFIEEKKSKELKCVYAIHFDDGSVKIGVSKEPKKRINTLSHASGKRVVESWFSDPLENAFDVEHKVHKRFYEKRLEGEYFRISYADALEAIAEEMAMIEG